MKRIITIIALQSLLLVASEDDNGSNYIGKKGLKKAQEILGAVPASAGAAGDECGETFSNKVIETMNSEKGREAAFNWGQAAVQGAAAGAAGLVASAGKAVTAKVTATALAAKAATIAGATVAAPYAAGGAVVLGAGYVGYRVHDSLNQPVERYTRCLNSNFNCDELNSRGLPKRCDSPERKAWNYLGRKSTSEGRFKTT